ncbi:phage antirepressor protein [archaeon]|nr:phage antirepressor protein [archaeon]
MIDIDQDNALVVFQDKKIRRIWHNDEWYFSVVDIVFALTESENPQTYWRVLKKRLKDEGDETVTNCNALKMSASDGKMRLNDVANTEQLFRIIQSIPSKKAEPFKRWLAKVGYERIQEIENPELAQERMKRLYEQKGYSKEWIDKRLRSIAVRQGLTGEWDRRGVEKNIEYAILTNQISNATFGKTVEEYRHFKGLTKEPLRDHMDNLELIFTMLGETVTTEITKNKNSDGFVECSDAAKRGGTVAGKARFDAETEIGKPIVSDSNYLTEPENRKLLKKR